MPRLVRRATPVFLTLALLYRLNTAGANPFPPDPEPQLIGADSLLKALEAHATINRADAVQQLRILGSSNLPVLRAAIRIPYDDVQRAAFAALANIGSLESVAMLRAAFQDTSLSRDVRIAAAEALGDARDTGSISMLEDAARRSADRYFPRALRKAIRRMSEPDCDRPIMSFDNGRVWFRFLREDVASVFVADYDGRVKYTFDAAGSERVFDLLNESVGAGHVGEVITMDNLQIALRDGRKALLWMSGSNFAYADTSRFWHRTPFIVDNPELRDYISRSVIDSDRQGSSR